MTIVKANNTVTLDQTNSWTGNVIPNSLDVAQWNGTYTSGSAGIGAGISIYDLQITTLSTGITIGAGAGTLTLGFGGVDMSAATQNLTIYPAVVMKSPQTWSVTSSRTLTINGNVSDGGLGYGVTKSGTGTVICTGSNSYTGLTSVNAGAFQIGNKTATPVGLSGGANLASGATLTFYTTLGGTTGSIGGGGALTNSATTGSITVYQAPGFTGTLSSINSPSGSTLILTGDPSATTTIQATLGNGGQIINFKNGTWDLTGGGSYSANIEIDGGTVARPAGTGDFYNIDSFTITGGTFESINNYGMRVGNTFNAQGGGSSFSMSQTGGMLIVGGSPLTIGNTTAGANGSYVISSGTLEVINGQQLDIGASTSGSNYASVLLTGSATIIATGNLLGDQGTGARQAFVWTGGTLCANNINATDLTSGTSIAVSATSGMLANAGGNLAPGAVGYPGKTSITGNYAVTSPAAVMTLDVGGNTQASSFESGNNTYDNVSVTGTVTLSGGLAIYLTNGFEPNVNDTFDILYSTASGTAISGSFTNIGTGGRITTADGLGTFLISQVGNAIVLSNFVSLSKAPQFGTQPGSLDVLTGKTATFSVEVTGIEPITFQWYYNGAPVSSGTYPWLAVGSSTAGNAGSYYVVASNAYGSGTSQTVTLSVDPSSSATNGMLYLLNQTPVTTANGVIDSLGTTQGTLYDSGTVPPTLIAGPAVTGSAWDFGTDTGWVQTNSNDFTQSLGDINQSTGITVGTWVNLSYQINSGLDNSRAIGIGSGDAVCDVTTSNGGGQFSFSFDNGFASVASGSVLDGNWHHIVATLDYQKSSNNLALYVDGKSASASTVTIPSSFNQSTTNVSIGRYNGNGGPFAGSLAGVMVYDRALTGSEVSQIYSSGTVSNQAPVVVASAALNLVQWPVNTDTVYATVADDGLPNPPGTVTGSWSKVSAPSGQTVTFSGTSSLTSNLTFSGTGTYIVRYTASDSQLSNYADVIINVQANQAPVIASCTATPALLASSSGVETITLNAVFTDDGLPNPPGFISTQWTQISGPGAVTLAYPTSENTTASVPAIDGTYVFQFSASDGALTCSTNISLTVVSYLPPSVTASAATQDIIWPANSTTLEAAVTNWGPNPPGVTTVTWQQISGPAATLSASTSINCPVTLSAEGQYIFRVNAFDGVQTSSTTTWINVWSPGKPIVLPGSVRSLWLPAACTLSGTLLGTTGSNDPVQWTVVESPANSTVSFGTPNALQTTASFSAAGEYWLQLAATDGIYSNSARVPIEVYDPSVAPGAYGGGNFGYTGTNAGILSNFTADLQLPYNFTGLDWSRLKPPPPPYVHPRILFNPDDLADIQARLANTSGTSTQGPVLLNSIISTVTSNLTNEGAPCNNVYNDLSNGVTASFISQGNNQEWIVCLMGYEAFRCLIQNDTVGGAKVGAALATVANYLYPLLVSANSNDWQNVVFPLIYQQWLGYGYDFAYNFMTPAEQASIRQLLTLATYNAQGLGLSAIPAFHANTSNWNQWNGYYLCIDAFAVEGESGFDPNLIPRIQGNFERMWSMDIFPEGSLFEGMGKGALFAESLIALGKRGIMIPAITGANNHVHNFYTACMETTGYGFTWDEWAAGNGQYGNNDSPKHADIPVIKFLFPSDPVVDFIHRNEFETPNYLNTGDTAFYNISSDPGDQGEVIGRSICTLDFNTSLSWSQAVTQQVAPNMPLTEYFNNHGLMITRTDWTSNGMRLFFQPRTEPGGHAERDRNVFCLSAIGRIWIPYGAPEPESYDYSIDSSVVRIDNVGPSTVAAKFVDILDTNNFTYGAGDATLSYDWEESTSPGPLEAYNYNGNILNKSPLPWTNLGWWALPEWWYSTYSPLYWTPITPVQRAFRTAAMVRGTNSYVIVVDDIQKDANTHSYTNRMILWNDLTKITYSGSDAIVMSATNASQAMLVRVLRSSAPATFSNSFNSDNYNCLDVTSTTVTPNYILMLYPYATGTGNQLPTTTWVGNVLYVNWPSGQSDHIGFAPNADGRTRISYMQAVPGTTPPVITVPANITTTATSAQGNIVNFVVTGSDAIDGVVPVSCVPASGSVFPIGTTTVVCTATDSSLNSAESTFTVMVQSGTFALTAPTGLTANPANQSAAISWNPVAPAASYKVFRSLTSGSGFTLLAGDVTDTTYLDSGLTNGTTYYYEAQAANGAGTGPLSAVAGCTPTTVPSPWADEDLGSVGIAGFSTVSASGTISMTAAGTGISGNNDSFHFTALPWTGNCVVIAHFLGFGGTFNNSSTAGVMVRQNLNANSSDAFVGAQDFAQQYYWSYRASPGGGTSSVYITHSAFPQWMKLVVSGSNVTSYDSGDAPPGQQAWVQVAPAANITLSSTFYAGLAMANYNSATQCTGTFDNFAVYTAPAVSLPANQTLQATGSNGAVAYFVVSGSSNVDGTLNPVCTPPSGSVFPLGVTTVIASVTDNSGQVTTGTFAIKVVDTTPPVITVPADITVNCTTATGANVTYATSAVDLVSGTVPTTNTPPSGSFFSTGATTVLTTATDAAGNLASASFTVAVVVPPVSWSETLAPALTLSGTNFSLTVNATVPGRTYQLQGSTNLQPGSWINIGPAQTGGGGILTLSGTFVRATPSEFYRILLGP